MKAYRAVEVKLNAFLTAVPDASDADRFTSGERAHGVRPMNRNLGGPQLEWAPWGTVKL
jgi:hypothetical protein